MPLLRPAKHRPAPAPDAAGRLPLTDRITDLLIDMSDATGHVSATAPQLRRLAALSAEVHRLVAAGRLATVRLPSRIWDAPRPPRPNLGRDDYAQTLGDTLPRSPRGALRRSGTARYSTPCNA